MATFTLDPRLAADCHPLGQLGRAELLLLNNAYFPWLVLVPHSTHTEFFELDAGDQQDLLLAINTLSVFIKLHFASEKLNIASIGNIVNQLHIHIIGRQREDVCWPGVVWGTAHRKPYDNCEVEQIRTALQSHLGSAFISSNVIP